MHRIGFTPALQTSNIDQLRNPEKNVSLVFPMHPKFSKVLFKSISSPKCQTSISYSNLLNCQSKKTIPLNLTKTKIVAYTPQSKIFKRLKNTISVNKLEFLKSNNSPRKKTPQSKLLKKHYFSIKLEPILIDFHINSSKITLLSSRSGKN